MLISEMNFLYGIMVYDSQTNRYIKKSKIEDNKRYYVYETGISSMYQDFEKGLLLTGEEHGEK